MIDLRSDTVTRPTKGMLAAMFEAKVGDDVFGEDPTVNALEERCARIFGMEKALFCPSGTMTNQIGINILSNPYEEVICYKGSHIYLYEGGGIAGNSGLSFRLIDAPRGILTVQDVLTSINPDDVHYPKTSIVALENTVNKGGGACYSINQIREISLAARSRGLKMHLDGARLFNAIIARGEDPVEYGQYFDTISLCLSKGLGAPVGSVLISSEDLIRKARRMRKVFGGGMRQAGYLAAAGLYALDHHIDRLKEDHQRAMRLGESLKNYGYIREVLPVETNIVIFEIHEDLDPKKYLQVLTDRGVQAVHFGGQLIRLVTSLEINDDDIDRALKQLKDF
ncbi:threonine aldolase family protein [Fulvivirga sedimenti]|uniref:Aminotransferase class I/II-fold pyridoxal phosphate-dependent enzyme n=1 Tax=Fulvivirga sedimenti TaxID=2879465 RepID=A0A9X1HMP0_9BACT|nr:GntG family PLP-dependent aldolase [Fulvivirga sedimenti]MCA6074291.1 aminotransferase class I/II-fold pyridoxal phosphate-dependent enzyme [Fulvivirga sedimenti]